MATKYELCLLLKMRLFLKFNPIWITHKPISELASAIAGVDESGVFEKVGSQTQHAELTKLFCANIPVRQDGKPSFLNRKYIVVDDQIVITSSLNFSNNANTSNAENVVIVDTSDIAALYIQEFDRVWTQGKVPDPAKLECN